MLLEGEIAGGTAQPETHFWLGYTYLALGAKDRAIAPFEQYLKSKPDDEDVFYALARTYAQLAEMSLQQIFQLDSTSARSYQMRGIRFELESSWLEAIVQYRRASKLDVAMPGVFSAIGRIYNKELRKPQAARQAYRMELARFPLSREANEFFAELQPKARAIIRTCYSDDASRCQLQMPSRQDHKAEYLLARHDPDEALPGLIAWRAREPQSVGVYYYLGEAFTDLKVRTIRRLKEARPQSFRLHQLLAESYASTHKKAEAIQEYRRAIELSPKTPGLRYELAQLISDTETQSAAEHLRQELLLDPEHYLAKALLGRIYIATQEPLKARSLLEGALAAKPNLPDARKALGQTLAALGEFDEALKHYDAIASEQPNDEQIHFLRAQALQALGRNQEAMTARTRHQEVLRTVREPAPLP